MAMAIANSPSIVTMPDVLPPYPSILAFLIARFPQVSRERWQERIEQGKILNEEGVPIGTATAFVPRRKLLYYREAEQEPVIPFPETILFQNEEILVACKPHFLPVIPGGPYITECLLTRLQKKTGNPELAPINRIDRETSGLVLFSVKKENRGIYHDLFMHGEVQKTYQALCQYPRAKGQPQRQWLVENRIERGLPWFRMQAVAGAVNARSRIKFLEGRGEWRASS
jgi:tRNA pseudouridine32 synthase / 23S rRNA pseudouridine746 synthase